jgi:hypothetical protein
MFIKLTEGFAQDNFNNRAIRADTASKAAHVLSVATRKVPGIHQDAADAHFKASQIHSDAAEIATHPDQITKHQDLAKLHNIHGDLHNTEHVMQSGGHKDRFTNNTDEHKQAFKNAMKLSDATLKGELPMAESAEITSLISKIGLGDYANASVDFDSLMDNKLDTKLNERTKQLAAQLFGHSVAEHMEFVLEEVEEDDEVAAHLQTLADDTLASLADEDENVDIDEFVESFNTALATHGLEEKYALWRPRENGATTKGVVSPRIKKKVAKEKNEKRKARNEEVEPLQELKARTLRHYVGHAEKQIKNAEDEVRKGKAQGKGEVVKHFTDRIAKRKAGIKTVLGRQKDSAAERAASASAKVKEVDKKAKALDGPKKKAAQ